MNDIEKLVETIEKLTVNVLEDTAEKVQAKVRNIIRSKNFPARTDGMPSSANDLAERVFVIVRGKELVLRLEDPAGFVHSGTGRMRARPLFEDDEVAEIAQAAFVEVMTERAKGLR